MRTPADCFAYVDKLAFFGSNYSSGRIRISPKVGGYGNSDFYFDDERNYNKGIGSWESIVPGLYAKNGVLAYGADSDSVHYVYSTNFNDHFFDCTNVVGYLSWGFHGDLGTYWSTNNYGYGGIRFHDSSSWYVIETIESYNGQWIPIDYQGSYHNWFAHNALGGSNYVYTPVGAITHTYEPFISEDFSTGVSNPYVFFGLWEGGRSFGLCAWVSSRTDRFQPVGDPFVTK